MNLIPIIIQGKLYLTAWGHIQTTFTDKIKNSRPLNCLVFNDLQSFHRDSRTEKQAAFASNLQNRWRMCHKDDQFKQFVAVCQIGLGGMVMDDHDVAEKRFYDSR